MKDFDKMMKDLRKTLSGLDDKIAEQVDATFKKYEGFFGNNSEKDADDEDESYTIKMPNIKMPTFKFDFGKPQSEIDESDDEFVKMAPFLDEESLHELVVEFCDSDLQTDMKKILPFLEEEDVALIMDKFSGGATEFKGLCLDDLFPFAPEESIDKLFIEKVMAGDMDEKMLSFVSDDCWHEIVVKYCEDENSNLNIDAFYPFLDDEDLNLLFKTYLKRRKKNS